MIRVFAYLNGIGLSPEKSRSAHALTKVLVPTQKFSIWQIQPVFPAIENLRVKTIPLAIFARIRDVSGLWTIRRPLWSMRFVLREK